MSFNSAIFLLIFCLEDLSTVDSGVLKSPTMTVLLSISFLNSSRSFFLYLGAPMLGAHMFTRIISSCWTISLSIMQSSFFVSCYGLCFEVYFVWYKYCYLQVFFFLCPFVWNIFFYPFSFSLCISFVLRCVSCRQHIYVGHVFLFIQLLCCDGSILSIYI